MQKKTKIVHFDSLKKATKNPVKLYQSEEEAVPERSSESDSDFDQVAPRTRNVPTRVRAVEAAPGVDLADAQETLADKPASPQHRAVVPQSPNRTIAEVPKALPVKSPATKAAVIVSVATVQAAVSDAKAQSGATTASTYAEGFRRVLTRTNKKNFHRRYSHSSTSNVTMTTVLLSLLFLLFLAAATGAQDVIVFPKLGAVVEKIGEVAVDLGSAQFPMLLRLVIHDTVHINGHFCLTNNIARHSFKTETNHLVPTWIDETSQSTITLSRRREKRSLILAAVGIAVGVSALFNLFSGSMTSQEIANIKIETSCIIQSYADSRR